MIPKIIVVLSLLLATFSHAGPPPTWQAKDCLLTRVYLSDQVINLEFTGHWTTSIPGITFASTDKNGVVFRKGKQDSDADWKKLGRAAQAQRNHVVTLTITAHSDWMMRGGIPNFQIPPDMVTIVQGK